ncbi:hypothetical protein [Pseudophaeobacter sp.]|uniref:hypothetical protein n=1 Tax=Pseudophaeobacter sp. TaxID=1971739 RepID=UPI004059F3A5
MKKIITFAAFASALTACAPVSPYDACVGSANSEVRSLKREKDHILEKISRGYETAEREVARPVKTVCYNQWIGSYSCEKTQIVTETYSVPVDLTKERQRLEIFERELQRARQVANAKIQNCEGLSRIVPE